MASAPTRSGLAPPAGDAFRDPSREWLEADGLGGYASGCASGIRTRRYHALLLTALAPPIDRYALVSDLEVWIESPAGRVALSSHRYAGGAGDVVHPDGAERIAGFEAEPWPRWRHDLGNGVAIHTEWFVPAGTPAVVLRWTLVEAAGAGSRRRARGDRPAMRLLARPLLAARDAHALAHANPGFCFDAEVDAGRIVWRPYAGLPAIAALTSGDYAHAPDWYRNFLYAEERARGLDHVEDLASPGVLSWDLEGGEAACAFVAEGAPLPAGPLDPLRRAATVPDRAERREAVVRAVRALATAERRRRRQPPTRLHRAAGAYFAGRGRGLTVIAGYPWFTDWGRDTFIALRGLTCALSGLVEAAAILLQWAGSVSDGMMPNRFADRGGEPEFNSVDASLWFPVAVHDCLEAAARAGRRIPKTTHRRLEAAVLAILDGYAAGTRFGIRLDADGLIAAGEPGVALTWMDARVDGRPVTPRIGKPVEVQALWLNALRCAGRFTDRWNEALSRGARAFRERFVNPANGALYDVVDVDHVRGAVDAAVRPNMLLAAGGLPFAAVDGARARAIVELAERELWTPLGPRSLSPRDPRYAPRYEGDVAARDAAYHQGTVWPWLAGPFVEAWVRARGDTIEARREARERFVPPLLAHLDRAGLGHVSEIADGDAPHTPRGCPFQAWSVGELLRVLDVVLDERRPTAPTPVVAPAALEPVAPS